MKTVTTTTALASVLAVLSATAAAADNSTIRMAERADFRLFEALSTEVPPASLFPYNSGLSTRLPPRFMPAGTVFNKPIPTNNWWGNMIAASTDAQAQPVWSNPYAIRASLATAPFGLTVSYPFSTRAFGGSSGNGGANKYYLHAIINDFTFSAREFNGPPTFEVFNWDDLAVSVRVANGGAKMESTLVSGMALTTTKYTQLTPKLDSAHAYLTVNGANVQSGSVVSGNRFVVTLNSGQKWVIYTSASITFTLNGFSSLVANGPFNGWIRSGLVVSDAQLAALDRTRNCLLEGGDVQARDTSNYSFNLKVSGDCSQGLFHYLQVHHMDTLDRASASEVAGAGSNSATRGPMTGVLTKTNPPQLRFVETQNVPAEFYPPRRPAASDVQQQRIKETLISDINAAWNIPLDGSYYFNGKLAQKYASLCLIANDETVTGGDKPSLLRTCLNKLETVLQPFLTNSWKYPLHYDTTYRGIVSSQGFFLNDMNADFGNTMYNDHHYHWGYWITTAAIVNFLDPSWSQIKQLNRITSFLVRDVANPSTSDTNFPKFRNFDWFRGHSFSHGVTPFADGKDQESTSEEINFHYGLALFGRVTGDTATANIGQLMLKLNTRSIQNYFLMTNDNRVHPPSIKPNKVTGIFFDNKADYGTWFSAEKYAIHGIQMLPVTAVTEFVRTRQFVQEEWDAVLGREPDVLNVNPTNPWMSILFMNLAVINKPVGLQLLQRVTMDDGLTRSWALYMAATRP